MLSRASRRTKALKSLLESFEEPQERIDGLLSLVGEDFAKKHPEHHDGLEVKHLEPMQLAGLFELYDRGFFQGLLGELSGESLSFRLSGRMTRAAGKLGYARASKGARSKRYELVISRKLLEEGFAAGGQVKVNGLACATRLEVLMRVFEHELVHLAQVLAHGGSRCGSLSFKELAERLFGHKGTKHELLRPAAIRRKTSAVSFRVGEEVVFTFRGAQLQGRVNRITKRATVLVEDATGRRYDDGKLYRKYYVPFHRLEPISGAGERRWWLYLLECRGGVLYAGIALDVAKRFAAHLSGKGAKFTRANPPLKVLGARSYLGRSLAQSEEAKLKKLRRPAKLAWAASNPWRGRGGG